MASQSAPTFSEISAGWAAAVHELRQPTSVVLGLADSMDKRWDQTDADDLRAMVAVVRRNAARLVGLIDRLLLDARIDSESLGLEIADHPVRDALAVAVDVAVAHQTTIDVTGTDGLAVRADILRIEQILSNLVDNACRHGAPPIEVTCSADRDRVTIAVHDHGPGLDIEHVDDVFQQFAGTAGGHGSNGLGLHTARRLARAMHGDLTHQNGDAGATFLLRLPAAQSEARARTAPSNQAVDARGAGAGPDLRERIWLPSMVEATATNVVDGR